MADKVAMRFVGEPGQFLRGPVPARDLTADEVKQWPQVKDSPLYQTVTTTTSKAVTEEADDE